MLSLRVFRIVWLAAFAASIAPSALAVQFDVVRAAYRVDSGYGTGPRDLDVRFFTGAFMPTSFELTDVGDSVTFRFGTIKFQEGLNIGAGERDGLRVRSSLTFEGAFDGVVSVIGGGGARLGPVNDAEVDFEINFDPVTVEFGSGGAFQLDFSDPRFVRNQSLETTATVTLLALPDPRISPVPEPATLGLLAAGLAGLAARRRARALARS